MNQYYMRGYFGIGIQHCKKEVNIGTLWRSANLLNASYIFTIGRRYSKQASDTMKTFRHMPLFHFTSLDAFYQALPYDARLIGIEISPEAVPLHEFVHPQSAVYLLGAEDHGLTKEAMEKCHSIIRLPGERSMNVSVAGSIVMYDRLTKLGQMEAV